MVRDPGLGWPKLLSLRFRIVAFSRRADFIIAPVQTRGFSMPPTCTLAELIEKAAALAQIGSTSDVSADADAPFRLFDQGSRAHDLYIILPKAGDAFVELSHRDLGHGRTLVVDRRRAPAIVGDSEFTLWFTQDAGAEGVMRYGLSADVIGRAMVRGVSFDAFDKLLAMQTSPLIERRLTHLALSQAVNLQSQIRAAQISGPHLRIADRLLAYVTDRENRRGVRANEFDARDIRRFLVEALKEEPSEISRALGEFERSGVLQFGRGSESTKSSLGQVIRIVDRGHLDLLADLCRQRAAVDVANARERLWALLRSGATLPAKNAALELLKQFPCDAELTYLAALAHARMGGRAEASDLLRRFNITESNVPTRIEIERLARRLMDRGVEESDENDEAGCSSLYQSPNLSEAASNRSARALTRDVVALAARLSKDAFAAGSPSSAETLAHGRRSFEIYRSLADWAPHDHYPAANAAAMAALTGELQAAENLAERAAALAVTETGYWAAASRAEALLVSGRTEEALVAIRQAAALAKAGSMAGDVGSTRRQLGLLRAVRPEASQLSAELPPFTVAAFSGHLAPSDMGAARMREHEMILEADLERLYAAEELETLFTALARGSDIISARAARNVNPDAALHVVLPFDVADFKAMSVGRRSTSEERDWNAQFDKVAAEISSLRVVWPRPISEADRWSAIVVANKVMSGLALLHADRLYIERRLFVAVSAEGAVTSAEGTIALARDWREKGLDPIVRPCPWRAPASGSDEAAKTTPWVIVASFQSADPNAAVRLQEAVDRDASHGLVPTKDGMIGPMRRETLAALVELAAGTGLRGFADYVYAPRGAPKPADVDLVPDPLTLAAGSLIATERLAAAARYEFGAAFEFLPAGLRERSRKARAPERAQAPSLSLYRIAQAACTAS